MVIPVVKKVHKSAKALKKEAAKITITVAILNFSMVNLIENDKIYLNLQQCRGDINSDSLLEILALQSYH